MNPTTNNQITFSGLGNPEKSIQTPPAQTPVEPLAPFTAPTTQETQNLSSAQTQSDKSLEDLTSAMFGGSSLESMSLSESEKAGIPTLNKDLTDIENQLRQTDLNFRRERERLTVEPGLTAAQRNARLADISRKQTSQLADLEIIRQARSNVLFNAESLVQKKVAAEFADQERNIDGLKFMAEKAEGKLKTQLELAAKKEERAYQVAKSQFETIENEKLQLVKNARANGAGNSTLSAILSAKTLDEAYKNAGSWGVSIDDKIKQAQLNKIRSEIPKDIPETEQEKALTIASKIQDFNSIINNKLGFKLAVGPTRLNRTAGALDLTSGGIGARQDFIASVEQLVSEETLNSLINAKAKGATFGALSEGELTLLKQTASKIGKWAKTDKSGKVIGYEAPETSFMDELNTLKRLQVKAYEKATGKPYLAPQSFTVNPQTGGIVINAEQDDESFWNNDK